MPATRSTDINFVPQVFNDHAIAYFDEKLGLSSLALVDRTLEGQPGETLKFPYFKLIGDVQEPAEDEGLEVDRLLDDEFSVTIKEVGKAVGWTDKARRKSANSERFMTEAQNQMGLKFAKKMDDDLIDVLVDEDNSVSGFAATANTDVATVARLLTAKIAGFGDKSEDAVAVVLHSQHFLSIMTDSTAGFLKADSNDPFYNKNGFMGRILNMAVFVSDRIPEVTAVGGKKVRPAYILKSNPFGIFMAEDMNPEMDRDILMRENLVSATMWYGVLSLHGKVSADDKRVARAYFATQETA